MSTTFLRSRRFLEVTALLILVSLPLVSLAAQDAPPGLVEVREAKAGRRGFWVGLGLGAGGESYHFRDGRGYSPTLYQPTISFRLGGTVSQHLRMGAEVLSWINGNGPTVESLSSGLFIAQYYPASSLGLYLKGGIGIGRNAVNFDDGSSVWDTGFAALVGAGFELPLGSRVYLNPVVDLVGHTYDAPGGDYRERLVHFGLGVLVQTGR
jgi:hypothetical protein